MMSIDKNSIKQIKRISFIVFVFSTFLGFGQTDSIHKPDSVVVVPQNKTLNSNSEANQKTDSVLAVQQDKTLNLITSSDSKNLNDSIQQLLLTNQLKDLRTRDSRKRARIQASIDSLKKVQIDRDFRVKNKIDSLRAHTVGVPVLFFKDTIFNLYAKFGSLSPSERAERIQNKLEALIHNATYDEKLLVATEAEGAYEILHGDIIITSITTKDAFWVDKPMKEFTEEILATLKIKLSIYEAENSLQSNIMRIGLLLIVLIVFYFVIKYINKGVKYANKKLITKYKHHLKGIRIKNYEFLSQEKEENIIRFIFKGIRILLIITVVYITLPTILSIFPATAGVAAKLVGFILNPLKNVFFGFVNFVPSLFTIVIIIMIARYIVRFLEFLSVEISNEKLKINGFYPDWSKPTFGLLKIIIYAFSFVVIFPYLPGSDSSIFKGVSVFFGLLISLGSSSAIGNIIAGLVITYMRAFKIGDRVKIADTVGDVIEKTMLVTRVRTSKNEEVSIPNAAILNGSTINYSSTSEDLGLGLVLHTTVTIGYDVPWPKVHEVLLAAALKTSLVDDSPKPFVLQTSLDDFYVSYQLNAYTKHPKSSPKIYSELHANIQDGFNESGVEILSPHYRASRDGNASAVPPEYLGKGYKAPSFNVHISKEK